MDLKHRPMRGKVGLEREGSDGLRAPAQAVFAQDGVEVQEVTVPLQVLPHPWSCSKNPQNVDKGLFQSQMAHFCRETGDSPKDGDQDGLMRSHWTLP